MEEEESATVSSQMKNCRQQAAQLHLLSKVTNSIYCILRLCGKLFALCAPLIQTVVDHGMMEKGQS